MNITYSPSRKLNILTLILIVIGVAATVTGFLTDSSRTWSNLLLNNIFFLTLSIGSLLFYSIQYITGSEWSALLQRVPLSMGAFLPLSALLMLLMYFGLPQVYEWAHPGIVQHDQLIAFKSPFLNVPFFMIRMLIYFAFWLLPAWMLWKLARQEDQNPGMRFYEKSALYSKIFIFSAAILFSFAILDWIMTIDPHWYSTLFGFRWMITSIYFGVAGVVLFVFFLRSRGFLPQINQAHRHDLARYLFRFSIVFGYLWFMQFFITWYANIPELTAYYYPRFLGEWQFFFYAEPILGWAIPFVVLMSDELGRKKPVLLTTSILLIIGLWISLFLKIMPGSQGALHLGFIEIGIWLGFAGIFLLLTFLTMSRMNLIPMNHPMLERSIHHHI